VICEHQSVTSKRKRTILSVYKWNIQGRKCERVLTKRIYYGCCSGFEATSETQYDKQEI
jgi:hypothetical protein